MKLKHDKYWSFGWQSMNVLDEIEKKIESIKVIDDSYYLEVILSHIKRAEHYYQEGKKDEAFFNDVIYIAKHT